MPEYTVRTLTTDEDADALGEILSQCFNVPASFWPEYLARIGRNDFRVLHDGANMRGGLAAISMGQWFGGRSVPMAGIAAVGISPEARGLGAAGFLMRRVLSEARESGLPLSTLYSAARALYRGVGYEAAGHQCVHEIAAQAVRCSDRELPVRAVDPDDVAPLAVIERERARANPGNLDRGPAIWRQVTHDREGRVLAYAVGPEASPEGYVLFRQVAAKGGGGDYDLMVRDLVALTPSAQRRIWTLLSDHRSQAGAVRWVGPAADPHLLVHPDHVQRVVHLERWYLRILDVGSALEARGYGSDACLHLDVSDDLFPENAGRAILRVEGGRGRVERGGSGDLRMDVRGLAPLYTGFLSATTLARTGLVAGGEESLATADRIFAGPEPWMPDGF